ncbi:TRAP transporter substrate-binding protein [Streptomyces sp. TLI_185]|uniref:TRAP transporter substrate-binding protein n=1 Tax=Streptomyces sp. TLI_185 TaxID=2485151 RepID=UPI000FAE66DA|nr:TRAP transporter substrate-binding protein DctP [Streptomyces sp. TLI_185]RPF39175.1 TRAP-type C4-dicarboxylate transport system substrate-binding protein [Streptomyces sp. TLI_185]
MKRQKRGTWAATAAVVALVLVSSGCSATGSDRAGGHAGAEPTVLTLANPGGSVEPPQLVAWAKRVEQMSKGTIRIRFRDEWREGQARPEVPTLDDIRKGKADMAWVGARAFDRVGITDFQALLAPMLVDSYELEAKVFEAGIPAQMLGGVRKAGLVGIGVLPGPVARLVGTRKPMVNPDALKDEKIASQDSALMDESLRAWGATPVQAPPGVDLSPFGGIQMQLGAVVGRHHESDAKYVTGNIGLWPRALVVVMGKAAHNRLSARQREILADALKQTITQAVDASRAEDRESAPTLCRMGMKLPSASASDVKAMRSAVQPVYARLRNDKRTANWLAQIQFLKETTGVGPDTVSCPAKSTAAGPLQGQWTRTMTESDWRHWPGYDTWPERPPNGTWTLTFNNGILTKTDPNGETERWPYQTFRDRIHLDGLVTFNATFHLDAGHLTFDNFDMSDCPDCAGYVVTFGGSQQPWVSTAVAH